jgi:hypothetical protein
MEQKASDFQRIITGDGLWFFFRCPGDSVLAASRGELPQSIKQKIDTEKCLVSIPWSVNEIPSLLNVFKGTTYNTAFFTDAVMPSLIENVRSRTRRKMLKRWLIPMDNARHHNPGRAQRYIEASRAGHLPYPASSPDPARTDVFLFGDIKGKLSHYNWESREDLLNAITQILTGADQDVLLNVFKSWENRQK